MRYSELENTQLVGMLFPNRTVTIKLIDMATDTLISINDSTCVESNHMPGVYIWKTVYLNRTNLVVPATLLYEMTSAEDKRKYYGKIIIGGYLDKISDIDTLVDDTKEIMGTVDFIFARQ